MRLSIFLLLVFVLVGFVSAVPSLEVDDNYPYVGESVVGFVKGINQTLSSDDLKFYEGRREVSLEKDLIPYENGYAFYVNFNRGGAFILKLENLVYYEGGNLKSITLEENFSTIEEISENGTSGLSIKPAVVSTVDEAEVTLLNFGTSDMNISYLEEEFTLSSMESKKISFKPIEKYSEFVIESYKSFRIPVFYSNFDIKNQTEIEKSKSLQVGLEELIIELFEGDNFSEKIELFNFGTDNLTKIKVKSEIDFLKFEYDKELEGKSAINMTVSGKAKEKGFFEGNISIDYREKGLEEVVLLPVEVYVFRENATEEEIRVESSCFDLGGVVCSEEETCDGDISEKIEGCCIGLCDDSSGGSDNGAIIGFVLVLVVLAIGYYVFKKYKGVGLKQVKDKVAEAANN